MPGGFNFGGSSSSDDSTLDTDLTISGVNAYAYIDGVANETITIKVTVIGIYDSSEARTDGGTIYMNTDTAAKFLSTDDYNDGNYDVDNVNYYMVIVIEKGPGAIARATGILCSRMQDVFS